MPKKYTIEEIKSYLSEIEFKLLDDDYQNSKTNMNVEDKIGYRYFTTLVNLKSKDKPLIFYIKNPHTIYNLKLWLKINNKLFSLISSEFNGTAKHLKWKCNVSNCNEIFDASWSNIQSHWGCPYCSGAKTGISNCLATKNPELAKEFHPTKNGELTPYDMVGGSKLKIWWQCKNNIKHEWLSTVANRNNHNSGCPYCSGTLPDETNNLLVVNYEIAQEWDYTKNKLKPEDILPNSNKKVWWKCKKCEHEWQAKPLNRNQKGSGCPNCAPISKGEDEVIRILNYLNIKYIPQYKINDCRDKLPLPFDFYLPDYNVLIEYQGLQHYSPSIKFGGEEAFKIRQYHDQIKRDYCIKNKIKLLEIPYWYFDNIEKMLKDKLKKEVNTCECN